MLQNEFEQRTGISVSAEEFETIHNLYMNCGEMDKDEFCKLYKSKSHRVLIDAAVKDLTIANEVGHKNRKEIMRLTELSNNLQEKVDDKNNVIRGYEESFDIAKAKADVMESKKLETMYRLIEISETYSSAELRSLVIEQIGFRRYLAYKLEHGKNLWALDHADIVENWQV